MDYLVIGNSKPTKKKIQIAKDLKIKTLLKRFDLYLVSREFLPILIRELLINNPLLEITDPEIPNYGYFGSDLHPYEIIDPGVRWFPGSDSLSNENRGKLLPPLVDKIRSDVKVWRDANYPNISEVSRSLLNFWFKEKHKEFYKHVICAACMSCDQLTGPERRGGNGGQWDP